MPSKSVSRKVKEYGKNLDHKSPNQTMGKMRRFSPLKQFLTLGATSLTALSFSSCDSKPIESRTSKSSVHSQTSRAGDFIVTHQPIALAQFGPETCASCHAEQYEDWKVSHHAKANRLVTPEKDRAAFTPSRQIKESGVTYEMTEREGHFWLDILHPEGSKESHKLIGVIGETPVRQYLTEFDGNKMQTISASYDVLEDRWVDVFAGEDRMPGEWGHWSGQGMNWNANCAYCHTTDYKKKFEFDANRYASTWMQQGIACAECHTGLETHVKAARSGDYETGLSRLNRPQIDQNCATCHSRRDQLTADAFKPGDAFHNHFNLALPDQPGLYHADGKILDEVFVWTSFKMSRMGHAGVSCLDCHNPHSNEPIRPIENNMLCMRCHESGLLEAPIIQPEVHSFHPAGSTGNQCVSCHMPKTTYMQVDPRADHGFHHPDPRMTKELGIPNACSNCHSDQSVDWAIKHAESWYGARLVDNVQRKRARAIQAAYNYQPDGLDGLLELASEEAIPAWRATYAGLLANYLPNEKAVALLRRWQSDESALVRDRVINSLGRLPDETSTLLDALNDPSQSVRISAARSLSTTGNDLPEGKAADEWATYLDFNSDRPQSLFMMAQTASRKGQPAQAKKLVERAMSLDSVNPEMYHQGAILLSAAGLNEDARKLLYKGWELAPKYPMIPYSLGLLAAEEEDYESAVGFLEETVALDPRFYRAWYNLSLAYRYLGREADAAQAYKRAQGQ